MEEKRLGDNAVTEGWAMLFDHLIDDRAWLSSMLDFPRPDVFAAEGAVRLLFYVRRYSPSCSTRSSSTRAGRVPDAQRYVELLGDALQDRAEPGRTTSPTSTPASTDSLRQFIRMYNPHEAREDTVLFPAFRGIVSANEFDSLGEDFERKRMSYSAMIFQSGRPGGGDRKNRCSLMSRSSSYAEDLIQRGGYCELDQHIFYSSGESLCIDPCCFVIN